MRYPPIANADVNGAGRSEVSWENMYICLQTAPSRISRGRKTRSYHELKVPPLIPTRKHITRGASVGVLFAVTESLEKRGWWRKGVGYCCIDMFFRCYFSDAWDPSRRLRRIRSVDSEIIWEDGWIAKENNRESLFEDIAYMGLRILGLPGGWPFFGSRIGFVLILGI